MQKRHQLFQNLHPTSGMFRDAFFSSAVTDAKRLRSSTSGIKLINSDLQYKALWTECVLWTEPDWRETLTPQPSLRQSLMTFLPWIPLRCSESSTAAITHQSWTFMSKYAGVVT